MGGKEREGKGREESGEEMVRNFFKSLQIFIMKRKNLVCIWENTRELNGGSKGIDGIDFMFLFFQI